MLKPAIIAQLRLENQQIAQRKFTTPQALVVWHGAKQAQDYTHAKWAIGLRIPGATDDSIEHAIREGTILRTHILRPTWHFVAAPDIRWMMRLTAPQIAVQGASRERDLGLDAATYRRTNDVIARALEGGKYLSRQALAEAIEKAGIMTNSSRMVHIMMQAELDLVVCNGVRQGKELTYALLDERVPAGPDLSREESLAELARRYFTSHAPATLQDFTWWSGLKVGDARAALEMIKSTLISRPLDALTYWMPKELELPDQWTSRVHLLPAFDEYLVSYKDRGASLDPALTAHAITSNGIFKPVIVIDGRVAGVWTRTEKKNAVVIEPQLFRDVNAAEKDGILAAAREFARFLNLEAVLKGL
jgi:hypothetical protein